VDVTEEEIEMAKEAQTIMKRLGEIKAQLSSSKLTTTKTSSGTSAVFRQQHLQQEESYSLAEPMKIPAISASFPSSASSSHRVQSLGSRPGVGSSLGKVTGLTSSSSPADMNPTPLLRASSLSIPTYSTITDGASESSTATPTTTTTTMMLEMEPSGSEDIDDDPLIHRSVEKSSNNMLSASQKQPMFEYEEDDIVAAAIADFHESRNPNSDANDSREILKDDDDEYDGDDYDGDKPSYPPDSPAPYDEPTRYHDIFKNNRYLMNYSNIVVINNNNSNSFSGGKKMIPSLEPIASFDSSESTLSLSEEESSTDVALSRPSSGDFAHPTVPFSKQQRPVDPSQQKERQERSSKAYHAAISLIDNTLLDSSAETEESEDNIVFPIGNEKTDHHHHRNDQQQDHDCNDAMLSSFFCGTSSTDHQSPCLSTAMTMTSSTPIPSQIPSWIMDIAKTNENNDSNAVASTGDEGLEYPLEAFLGY
jgi:hypothetical protein